MLQVMYLWVRVRAAVIRYRRIVSGTVSTLSGSGNGTTNGTGAVAQFASPTGVAVDAFGNLYVADQGNIAIRRVIATGAAIIPGLPTGLSFSPTTAVISGTPTAVSPATTYTVTAADAIGPGSTTLSIQVNASTISYSSSSFTFNYGTPITTLSPTPVGATPTGYTISPALSAGLSFDPVTGNITGTPSVAAVSTPYTVTANYAGGVTATFPFTITVSKAPLTVTALPQTKTYGTTFSFAGTEFTTSGTIYFSDAITGATITSTGSPANASVLGSPYNIIPSLATGTGVSNYAITYTNGSLTVTKAALTVTVTATGPLKKYGTAIPTGTSTTNFTASPGVNGEAVTSVTLTPDANGAGAFTAAGLPYVVTPSLATGTGGFLESNYTVNYVPFSGTVSTMPITVTATAGQSKVYGTVDPTLTYSITSGALANGDQITGSLVRAPGENVGTTYAISQGTLTAGSNYTITYVGANFAITGAPLTVTATAGQNKVYGTTDPALTYSITSGALVNGDQITGTLVRAPGENVGTTYAITQGSVTAGSNYTITYVGANFAITAAPLTVTTTTGQSKVYGTTDPTFAYSVTSGALVNGDQFSGALARDPGENIGTTYAINQGTLTAGTNYAITFIGANFAITAAPITVTATAGQSKVYGTTDPTFAYSVTSGALVNGDQFSGALARDPGENVGTTYAISQGTLTAGTNYAITYVGANFAITAAPLTVTANAGQSKVYGTTDPTLTYSVTSGALVNGDQFTGALARDPGENIGTTYAINQGTLSAGTNYTITYAGANFAITAAPLTVTANPGQSKVYGTTDPILTYSVTSGALVNGDQFSGALARDPGENGGTTYAINQGSLTAGTNYAITYVGANFAITAAPLTVTANAGQSKVYGTTDPTFDLQRYFRCACEWRPIQRCAGT